MVKTKTRTAKPRLILFRSHSLAELFSSRVILVFHGCLNETPAVSNPKSMRNWEKCFSVVILSCNKNLVLAVLIQDSCNNRKQSRAPCLSDCHNNSIGIAVWYVTLLYFTKHAKTKFQSCINRKSKEVIWQWVLKRWEVIKFSLKVFAHFELFIRSYLFWEFLVVL